MVTLVAQCKECSVAICSELDNSYSSRSQLRRDASVLSPRHGGGVNKRTPSVNKGTPCVPWIFFMPLCPIWSLEHVGTTGRGVGCAGIPNVNNPVPPMPQGQSRFVPHWSLNLSSMRYEPSRGSRHRGWVSSYLLTFVDVSSFVNAGRASRQAQATTDSRDASGLCGARWNSEYGAGDRGLKVKSSECR